MEYLMFSHHNRKPIAMNRMNVLVATHNEIVFENRNKTYGAYQLRKQYGGALVRAMSITTGGILLAFYFVFLFLNRNTDEVLPDIQDQIFSVVPIDVTPQIKLEKEHIEVPKGKPSAKENTQAPLIKDNPDPEKTPGKNDPSLITDKGGSGDGKGLDSTARFKDVDQKEVLITKAPEYIDPEVRPEFNNLPEYLRNNLRYPELAKEAGIMGTVYLTFVVNEEGKVVDVAILRGVGGGLDQEAIRVISKMPDWKPGMVNGKPVRTRFNLPVKFQLK